MTDFKFYPKRLAALGLFIFLVIVFFSHTQGDFGSKEEKEIRMIYQYYSHCA